MKNVGKVLVGSFLAVMMFAGVAQALTITTYNGEADDSNFLLGLYGQGQTSRNVVLFDQLVTHTGSLNPQASNVDFLTLNAGTVHVNASVSSLNPDPLLGVSYAYVPGVGTLPVWRDQVSTGITTKFLFYPNATNLWGVTALGAQFTLQDPYGLIPVENNIGLIFTLLLSDGTTVAGGTALGNSGTVTSGFWGWSIDAGTNPTGLQIDGLIIESATGDAQTFGMTQLEYNQVPEPSTFLLLGAGLSGLMFLRRRK